MNLLPPFEVAKQTLQIKLVVCKTWVHYLREFAKINLAPIALTKLLQILADILMIQDAENSILELWAMDNKIFAVVIILNDTCLKLPVAIFFFRCDK
jgi:hypothetical protein